MSHSHAHEQIVWIDCEMTGLDEHADALIEIAALVTGPDLTVLGDGVDVVIRPPDEALAQMNDFVRDMHTTSGLLDELPQGATLAEAQDQVLSYVKRWEPLSGKAPLAGNSVATDKTFLARDMPALVDHLSYRIVDVSSIKELARRWASPVAWHAPAKHGGHRALADIRESINELAYYREAFFLPDAGADTARLDEIARRYEIPAGADHAIGTQPAERL